MIELRPICHNNWLDCIALEVAPEQRGYVNPNIFSLAEAYAHSDACPEDALAYYRCLPFCLYESGTMVGFVLLTYEQECDHDSLPAYEIYRLMIDYRHQHKGYGRAAVAALLDYIRTRPCGEAGHIYVQWHPENAASAHLFTDAGFTPVGTDEDGAVTARLPM
ncbi:MAG: GNAT family N-acetyltransferase [Clostridia bacterium]|nr:GNAT family N-acetyltransferase [Clostridia bacterium]